MTKLSLTGAAMMIMAVAVFMVVLALAVASDANHRAAKLQERVDSLEARNDRLKWRESNCTNFKLPAEAYPGEL